MVKVGFCLLLEIGKLDKFHLSDRPRDFLVDQLDATTILVYGPSAIVRGTTKNRLHSLEVRRRKQYERLVTLAVHNIDRLPSLFVDGLALFSCEFRRHV